MIDESRAISIAEKFLRQHNDNISLKDHVLKNGAWMITFAIGMITKKIMIVQVDANTGTIKGYS